MYTKDEIKQVINLWVDTPMSKICKKMDLSPVQVGYLVSLLRAEGMNLPKKHLVGTTRSLVKEVVAELK